MSWHTLVRELGLDGAIHHLGKNLHDAKLVGSVPLVKWAAIVNVAPVDSQLERLAIKMSRGR
jgi:hypothetical protein